MPNAHWEWGVIFGEPHTESEREREMATAKEGTKESERARRRPQTVGRLDDVERVGQFWANSSNPGTSFALKGSGEYEKKSICVMKRQVDFSEKCISKDR